MCAGQDRLSRDPALWSAQIAAADPDPGWAAFAAVIAAQTASGPNPPVLVLDHTGAPLVDADVEITRGSQAATARLRRHGWRRPAARRGAAARAQSDADALRDRLRGRRTGPRRRPRRHGYRAHPRRGRRGRDRARSRSRPQARHVTFTDLERWFAPQYANAALPPGFAPLADYTRGNRVTPFVNGLEYYEDLLAKLKQAAEAGAAGGRHLVGGWQTFPDTQLARRDDDEDRRRACPSRCWRPRRSSATRAARRASSRRSSSSSPAWR